jgi:hypothetical protein
MKMNGGTCNTFSLALTSVLLFCSPSLTVQSQSTGKGSVDQGKPIAVVAYLIRNSLITTNVTGVQKSDVS